MPTYVHYFFHACAQVFARSFHGEAFSSGQDNEHIRMKIDGRMIAHEHASGAPRQCNGCRTPRTDPRTAASRRLPGILPVSRNRTSRAFTSISRSGREMRHFAWAITPPKPHVGVAFAFPDF